MVINPHLKKKQKVIILILILLLFFICIISICVGKANLPLQRIIPTILGKGSFRENFILFSLRLPRITVTFLAGIALALSGSILQAITHNDLADPGIMGINAGAGVGVSIFYLFFTTNTTKFIFVLPLIAFVSSLLTDGLIYVFAYDKESGLHPIRLILTGVGFSLALSGTMVFIFSAVDPFQVDFIAKWMSGNIWGSDWSYVLAILPGLLILIPYTLMKVNHLNILSLSDNVAVGVGVKLKKERLVLLVVAVALASLAVSITGGISFIGLMAPHIAKRLVGPRHQLNLPITLLTGGFLLVLADTIARNISATLPTGIVVSLIGAPYFMYLLIRK
ncbi:MAG: iron ABC transporter permease [Bacilli bacterium]|nr:iron ABC transporter permease [Bacilli bacterium]